MRALDSFLVAIVMFMGCTTVPRSGSSTAGTATEGAHLSGKTRVPGLGVVALPPGKWRREQLESDYKFDPCDFCIFRKEGDAVHRLTIFRIAPTNAAEALYMYCDGLNERMGFGAVAHEWHKADPVVEVFSMHYEPSDLHTAKAIEYSFVTKLKSGSCWLSHSQLFQLKDGAQMIIVYSSTEATLPEVAQNVRSSSWFETTTH